MKQRKPEPRIVSQVCSLCGLDWLAHGDEPTTETCVRLLAAEVRRLETQLARRPIGLPVPMPYPYPISPPPWRPRPYREPFIYWQNSTRPQLSSSTPQPVMAAR